MYRTVERRVARWQALPLCCKYLVAQFESRELRGQKSTSPHRFVQWVFGTLRTGESEVLGLWLRDVVDWQPVIKDLRLRGLESIKFVVSSKYTELAVDSLRATAAQSIDHLLCNLPTSGSENARLTRLLNTAQVAARQYCAALRLP